MQELLAELSSALKVKEGVAAKRVHRLRTTIRRIDSLVNFVQPELREKQRSALDELAALRKRAGKVRDIDAQIALLPEIANGSTATDRRTVQERLVKKRKEYAAKLAAEAHAFTRSKLFAQVKDIGRKILDADNADNDPLRDAEARIAKLRVHFDPGSRIKPRRLHSLRVEVKSIRYLAEISEAATERDQLLERLKSVQDAIGSWHDWERLTRTAKKTFRERNSCPLLQEMRALLAARHSAAASETTHFFSSSETSSSRKPPQTSRRPMALAQRAG